MDCDVIVVGAGVVGLAVAAHAAKTSRSVFMLEQHAAFGQETSSRNSEVIHAGIYYPEGSLKARLCVEGARRLYEICGEEGIPHERIGKLVVAVRKEEIESLEKLKEKGEKNGVEGLRMINGSEVRAMEPHVNAAAALFSPNTGIVDSHALMKHFESEINRAGGELVYGCKVTGAKKVDGGFEITARDAEGESTIQSQVVVNCGGLHSSQIAGLAGLDIEALGLQLHYCKGEYFGITPSKSEMLKHLVYPSPLEKLTGLGIHATKDLGGRLKLGPNAFYVDQLDYDVDVSHLEAFFSSTKTFLPFLEKEDLAPDMAGMRPKLQGPGDPVRDFVIRNEDENGLPGWINLIGIESPGLTASPAIGDYVGNMLNEIL